MRLSNFLIVSSTAIVFSAALIFFVVQTFFGESDPELDWKEKAAQLEAENQSLIEEAARSNLALNSEIKSLKTSLKHSEKLLTENDDEIASLRRQSGADGLAMQLAAILNVEPTAVVKETTRLVESNHIARMQLEIANQRLAQASSQNGNRQTEPAPKQTSDKVAQNDSQNNKATTNRPEPRIKKFELAGPENGIRSEQASGHKKPEPVRQETEADLSGRSNAIALAKQVESLKIELRNREKLLFEQTSLIESLKKKQRVETWFRTQNGSVTSAPDSPFRDRGTFKAGFREN